MATTSAPLGPWRPTPLVAAVALVVPLLCLLPTIAGYRAASPPERVFLGFRYMAGDHYQYAAFVRQAAERGSLFLSNPFATEPQAGRYLLLYLSLVGWVSRVFALDAAVAWEAMKLVVGVGFLLAVWRLTAAFTRDASERLAAYLVVAFSGGLGWLHHLVRGEPAPASGLVFLRDPFVHPWNWSTLGTMLVPLWLLPEALLVVCAVVLARDRPLSPPAARLAAALALPPLIWFLHPYTGMCAYLALGLYAIAPIVAVPWRRRSPRKERTRRGERARAIGERLAAVFPFLASFALVAAYLAWARQDAVFARTSANAFTWNPRYGLGLYPWTYGLLLPLGLAGIAIAPDDEPERRTRAFLACWLVAALLLALNPWLAGVKFQYLLHVPLALFSARALVALGRRARSRPVWLRAAAALVLAAGLFLNAPFSLARDLAETAADPEIYLAQAELDAMRFLATLPAGNVLAAYPSGNRIAWLAGKPVYIGHWFLTPDLAKKQDELIAFLHPAVSLAAKRGFLRHREIRYVYLGPVEDELGSVDPALGLNTAYDRGGVRILAVP